MTLRTLAIAAALLSPTLEAQTAPCAALNDQNTTVSMAITPFGFAGPNSRAWQFTPTQLLAARSIRIFTGRSSNGFMTLEIWSDDPATSLPGSRITGGTWAVSGSFGTDWQGTNLDSVAILQQGTPYWIVWIDPHSSVIPTEPGGTPLPAAFLSGSNWTSISPEELKFRLYCNLLDDQGTVPVGNPCNTSTGGAGSVFTNQPPLVGNTSFNVEGTGFPGGSLTFLVLGINPNFASVPLTGFPSGCQQHTDALATLTSVTGTGNVRATSPLGHVSFPLSLPSRASLAGVFFGVQVAVLDSGATAPIPFAVSNGLQVTIR